MQSLESSERPVARDIGIPALGFAVFWTPYLLTWISWGPSVLSSALLWSSLVCYLAGLYITGVGTFRAMNKSPRLTTSIIVLLNVLGIAAFLIIASSMTWIEPGLEDISGASAGSAIVWGMAAFPLLLGFCVLDLMLLVLAGTVYTKKKMWRWGWTFFFMLMMWAVACYVDGIHHGTP